MDPTVKDVCVWVIVVFLMGAAMVAGGKTMNAIWPNPVEVLEVNHNYPDEEFGCGEADEPLIKEG